MHRISTNTAALAIVSVAVLAGCATNKEALLPHGQTTMLDVWTHYAGGPGSTGQAGRQLLDARQALRRPLTPTDVLTSPEAPDAYTRSASNEIYQQFRRLPNPDLVMYVFPHLAGTEPVPIPGYSTVFPFFRSVQYAMPGERTEDY
jgi:conjugative transfer region lipoprotein (TIGR03751 family)